MKIKYQRIAFIVVLCCFVVGYGVAVFSDPYIEYELSGFTHYDHPTLNQLTLGIETPPILGGLVFDFSLTGVLLSDATVVAFVPGSRFTGRYGSSETYIMAGCTIDTSDGFSPFLKLKLSVPLFAMWGSPGGI